MSRTERRRPSESAFTDSLMMGDTGLFQCFDDIAVCIMVAFIPCYHGALNKAKVDDRVLMHSLIVVTFSHTGLPFLWLLLLGWQCWYVASIGFAPFLILEYYTRVQMRKKYGMNNFDGVCRSCISLLVLIVRMIQFAMPLRFSSAVTVPPASIIMRWPSIIRELRLLLCYAIDM